MGVCFYIFRKKSDCVIIIFCDRLYTSGTTGKPKGIVRDTGGYAVSLLASMKYVYEYIYNCCWLIITFFLDFHDKTKSSSFQYFRYWMVC
jgi:acyl-CoA synthetase (AMP-forming)/AMP-acid ligase II